MEAKKEQKRPVKTLPGGWEVRLGLNGRVYYYSRHSHTVQVLPPPESWSCAYGLAYGWEIALDYREKPYFINHIQQRVSYDDPRLEEQLSNGDTDSGWSSSEQEPPMPREYLIPRHDKLGFGFIAGSEKPVIIRSVSPGGPSDNMLRQEDQIIKIGEENVKNAPRERVIALIRESTDSVSMTVLQPARVANSSFLRPGKKQMKGTNRPRVRFAEDNFVNGEERAISSSELLIVPGVLKVHLEESQSRSFQFNPDTTAGDIVSALCEKLDIKDSKLYSLVLTPSKSKDSLPKERMELSCSDEILIPPWDRIEKILNNPSVKHHECRLRLTFIAKDIHKMSREDPCSFRYHYQQCVNDVIAGDVFTSDLSVDDVLRLASLQMLELWLVHSDATSSTKQSETSSRKLSRKKAFHAPSKISLKQIEKDFGLERFLPPSVLDLVTSNHSKEHRKTLQQYLKANFATYINVGNSKPSSPPPVPSADHSCTGLEGMLLQLRMQYIKVLSPLHLYGGRYFDATILAVVESDITLIVGYHYEISQLINSKTKMASVFANFSLVESVEVASYSPEANKTKVRVDFKDKPPLVVAMQPQLALNFAYMISGYCRVHDNNDIMLTLPITECNSAPEYAGLHKVKVSHWNYPLHVDPSSCFYCDFSEPVTFCLLSDHIPDSVRSMYEQSKTTDEDKIKAEESSKEYSEELDGEPTISTKIVTPVEDEGVALTGGEVSLKSSLSSMVSASPSSGIGSVTSHVESHTSGPHLIVSEAPGHHGRSDDESEWNELIVALNSDDDIGSNSLENVEAKKQVAADDDEAALESQDSISNSDATVKKAQTQPANAVISNEANKPIDEESEETTPRLNPEVASTPSNDAASAEKAEIEGSVQSMSKDKVDPKSTPIVSSSVPVPNRRFSSFKPEASLTTEAIDQSQANASTPAEIVSDPANAITSDQLKAQLENKSPTPVQVTYRQVRVETDDFATSPLPVEDLARGHKSLKGDANKRKNRLSWFRGRNHSMGRSVSLDKELGKSDEKAKSKSLLRNFFSLKRSSFTGKEPELFTLPGTESIFTPEGGSGQKQKFSGSANFSPRSRKKTKFAFFKAFGRKKRSHTLPSASEIGSPILKESSPGPYSVFESSQSSENGADRKEISVPRTASMEDVSLRSRDKVPPKPRPISFMTFQQLPTDFKVQMSPKRKELSPVRPPRLPLVGLIRSAVNESDSESVLSSGSSVKEDADMRKPAPAVEVPFSSFLKADLEEHFAKQKALAETNAGPPSSTAPIKPLRNSELVNNAYISDKKSTTAANPNEKEHVKSPRRGKVKRPAPPPPLVHPKPLGRNRINAAAEISHNTAEESQVKTEGGEPLKNAENVQELESDRKETSEVGAVTTAAVNFYESAENHITNEKNANKEQPGKVLDDINSSIEISESRHCPDEPVEPSTDVATLDAVEPQDDIAVRQKLPEVLKNAGEESGCAEHLNNAVSTAEPLQTSDPVTSIEDNVNALPDHSNSDDASSMSIEEPPSYSEEGSLIGDVLAVMERGQEGEKVDLSDREFLSKLAPSKQGLDHQISHDKPPSLYEDSFPSTSGESTPSREDETEITVVDDKRFPASIQDEPSHVACVLNSLLLNGFDDKNTSSNLVDSATKSNQRERNDDGSALAKVEDPMYSFAAEDSDKIDNYKVQETENNNNNNTAYASNNKEIRTNGEKPRTNSLEDYQHKLSDENKQNILTEFHTKGKSCIYPSAIDPHQIAPCEPPVNIPTRLPTFLPPPEEFNVPLPPAESTYDRKIGSEETIRNPSHENNSMLSSHDCSEPVVISLDPVAEADVDQKESAVVKCSGTDNRFNATPEEIPQPPMLLFPSSSKPDKSSLTSPTSQMYHNLIAPRLFGQKSEVKRFSKMKTFTAPTDKAKPISNGDTTSNSAGSSDVPIQNGSSLTPERQSGWTPLRGHSIVNHVAFPVSGPRSKGPPPPKKSPLT